MQVAYDLRTPCKDCPFLKHVPKHDGVAQKLVEYHSAIERGMFQHTCHKTDKRSDGFEEGYTGSPQHCAGALIMLKKSNDQQDPAIYAEMKGIYKPEFLNMKANVFDSSLEFIKSYLPIVQNMLRNSKEKQQEDLKC